MILSDHTHPEVQAVAARLTDKDQSDLENLENIFHYVRDEIKFGMPSRWDAVKASETIACKKGYCNTKATLFKALCTAVDIPARIHTGLIDIQIMKGLMPDFVYKFMPETGVHSWIEVLIDGAWQPLDSYINDAPFYNQALRLLHASNQPIGFSISEEKGPSSCNFNFGDQGFVHMGAVVADHGVWDDYSLYMKSDEYVPLPAVFLIFFPLIEFASNKYAARIRSKGG
jgi:hypothetical protein